jgi:protein-disulfide isomerase
MRRFLPFIIVFGIALATLGSGTMLYRAKRAQLLAIPADGSAPIKSEAEPMHVRGNPDAPVTLEEFGDFECPSRKNLANSIDQLIKEYHPSVRLIFRNLLAMHPFARDAALATEAAGLQGRYWEIHDMLLREQAVWSSATVARLLFDTYAETLGLDLDQFRQDVKSDKVRERVESDQARAKPLGVKTAPTLFVDKREMGPNEQNPEGVRKLVDEAVKANSSASEKK